MIQVSRNWSTPLTIGSFVLMACTGMLMFFHLDSGLNKLAHEWLGWLMVVAVLAHVLANWPAFTRHLLKSTTGRVIVAACVLLLGLSFIRPPGQAEGASPPVLALQAVAKAPLSQVAPLTGKSVAQLQQELAAAGLKLDSAEQSIGSVAGDDRGKIGSAMRVLFAPAR